MSTAFPQPVLGSAPAAGPMNLPAERLRSALGITNVKYVTRQHSLAVVDSPLAMGTDWMHRLCAGLAAAFVVSGGHGAYGNRPQRQRPV